MLKVPQLGLVLTTDITIIIMTISEVYVAANLVVRKPKNVTMPTLMIDIVMINKQHDAFFPFIRQRFHTSFHIHSSRAHKTTKLPFRLVKNVWFIVPVNTYLHRSLTQVMMNVKSSLHLKP